MRELIHSGTGKAMGEIVQSVTQVADNNLRIKNMIQSAKFPAMPLRPYQEEIFRAFVNSPLFVQPLADAGYRPQNEYNRFFPIWCRRAGKDVTSMNMACAYAMMHKNVTVLYMFPELRQGVDAVQEGDIAMMGERDNIKFLDFVKDFGRLNRQRSTINLDNGSRIIFGSAARYNLYRGMGASLIVWSEFAYCHSEAEATFAPMIVANGGSMIYPTTPNGRNFAYNRIRQARMHDPATPKRLQSANFRGNCFVRIYPWYVLCDSEGYRILSKEDIDMETEREGMTKEMAAQEWECAFNKQSVGSVYGEMMGILRANGQIRNSVPINREGKFYTSWDIGNQDDTAIWLINEGKDGYFYAIDFIRDNCRPLDFFIEQIRAWEQTYDLKIHTHFFPHDSADRRLGISMDEKWNEKDQKNRAIVDLAQAAGLDPVVVKRPQRKIDGVVMVRKLLPNMVFDGSPKKCEYGVKSLDAMHRAVNRNTGVVSENAVRDWSCHACDALQTFAMGLSMERNLVLNPFSGRQRGYRTARGRVSRRVFDRETRYDWMA